jgi:hypothetical protein
MMKDAFLFPDFLRDPREYGQARTLWVERWEELVRSAGQAAAWESPFYTTKYVDGTPCRDGNPIFSAGDPVRRIGVRVIQFEPTGDAGELVSWRNTFAKGEPEEIEELVISCSLTDETLSKACDLIRQWITGGHVDVSLGPGLNQSFSPDLTPADRPA